MDISSLVNASKKDLSYNQGNKIEFHRQAKRVLGELNHELGLGGQIRSNMGGIAVSGEITLHAPKVYIQISGGCLTPPVMYRTCKGMEDYTGGQNNFTKIEDLNSDRFKRQIRSMVAA